MEEMTCFESMEYANEHLKAISKNENIIETIRHCLSSWDYKSTNSLCDFKEDIEQATDELLGYLFPDHDNKTYIAELIKTFIHGEIYDAVFFRIKQKLSNDDLTMYRISKDFCKNNGTPKQLGATFYNFIPNAAVVEMSMLSSKRTPMEKLKCLQCTYDNIFAEVKGALISVISKYSEKEIDIPSITNKEVIPIVMSVILKSKLFYFISDMSYIKEFGEDILNKNDNLSEIYNVFEESLKNILKINFNAQEITGEKLEDKLSVCDTISFIENLHKDNSNNNQSVFNEERKRVARLITFATTEDLTKYN